MERYVVCLMLVSGEERQIDVRSNKAAGAVKVAVIAHEQESMVPIRHVAWIGIEGVRHG